MTMTSMFSSILLAIAMAMATSSALVQAAPVAMPILASTNTSTVAETSKLNMTRAALAQNGTSEGKKMYHHDGRPAKIIWFVLAGCLGTLLLAMGIEKCIKKRKASRLPPPETNIETPVNPSTGSPKLQDEVQEPQDEVQKPPPVVRRP
ncbi:hypothetical protein K504DRAFT_455603 [Pleomassaria siparia CBS 279.74]|uniref:Mid2 domain-containing protein n=1 Tax=Pleomassaria siparia CBS 279.74 TaxID=1314801 RepID=A0A6G1K871_9PLEO|nr:hypothetical protein K504DRAFT_455603 [Pleomassaria siparia CBS 279.74]